jgi:hypothetical protein
LTASFLAQGHHYHQREFSMLKYPSLLATSLCLAAAPATAQEFAPDPRIDAVFADSLATKLAWSSGSS